MTARSLTLLASALLAATPALAQTSGSTPAPSPAAITALHRLDFLLGEWEGNGWIRTGPGEPATFRQHESVRASAGGTVIVIDGSGTSTRASDQGRVVHQAFAVLSFDPQKHGLRMRAYRADGVELDGDPVVSADTLVWGFAVAPGMRVRFTIGKAPDGAWHEVGHLLRDGAPPSQFFETTLRKVATTR